MMQRAARFLSRLWLVLPKLVALWFVLALLLSSDALSLSPTAPLTNYPTEAQAQQHCPTDTVCRLAQSADGHLSREGSTLVRPNQERSLRMPHRSEPSRHAWKPERAMSGAGHGDPIGGCRTGFARNRRGQGPAPMTDDDPERHLTLLQAD
jgi:hypothetical protein